MFPSIRRALAVIALSILHLVRPTVAFIGVIARDFNALTRKVTAHHILLPKSDEVALSLKQSIRNRVNPPKGSDKEPIYIVDAFSAAAERYSRDEETAVRGGLLGTLAPQGYCRAKELDAACFQVPLGEVCGPIESDYGYHLLLVTERTNCPKLDGQNTRISRALDESVLLEGSDIQESRQVGMILFQQVGFWLGASFAGGIVAELAAKASDIIPTLP
ncbi:hypothetical protein THAOC_31365 [Thalassiosira oceanica]|uniref:Peptidyl-prolyl cis-trans isomerase n=1 Tax=Thalassiosira oceanica TaxID=159749 RepID=K0RSX7_THAOC|nr:hypothetical protein THAOC_31365 [Thalassiosira oceanica]|eukprot:EJK49727.1 hypothetical protein THAOC_31365 [Thalassiosira oceanica]